MELQTESYNHELEGNGSLRKCVHCGRYFHNEGDAGAEDETCAKRAVSLLEDIRMILRAGDISSDLKCRTIEVVFASLRDTEPHIT